VSEQVERFAGGRLVEGERLKLGHAAFAASALGIETAVIVASSMVMGAVYHLCVYGEHGDLPSFASVGLGTALLYALPFLFRDEYRLHDFLEGRRSIGRIALVWTYAFLCLGVIGFMTKTAGFISRGWMVLFYVGGLAALIALSELMRHGLTSLAHADRIARRRLLLVGEVADIEALRSELPADHAGVRVVATVVLPQAGTDGRISPSELRSRLAGAATKARALRVDDVVILTDWSQAGLIHAVVEPFRALPIAIHLGASSIVGPFSEARISRFAAMTAVSLTAPPLTPIQAFVKRAFDVVVSAAALVLLAPLFLAVAALIKATSPGPVFFLQRRRGYNQVEFRIWKFRTMTTMDDGERIEQARPNDRRVTRVGRWLRRLNIDELPQLINVLLGEMSLVGPRPHAVAHDRLFEKRIAAYARRLNVRPGITGWAQVQGYRGLTDTDEAMLKRVECDLYYIDNWSIAFDLYIMALTVLSPTTYRNAH
jgi:Undecaprenyl-phosphate glucose phosphotransferase